MSGVRFSVEPHTLYTLECWRQSVLIWTLQFPNIVTTVGRNILLDATFKDGIGAAAWYIGLVDNAGWSAYAATDTMASHAGWVEGTPYSDGTRQSYIAAAAAAGSQTNSASKAVFQINATLTIRGAFLVNNSTKGGTGGTLYSVGDASASRAVVSGDQLHVQVTLTD